MIFTTWSLSCCLLKKTCLVAIHDDCLQTNGIFSVSMFCDASGQQRTICIWQFNDYTSDVTWKIRKSSPTMRFLWSHWWCWQWLKDTSRKQMVFKITHYKKTGFISQNVRVALTIVNVEYSEFMNLLDFRQIQNTLTKSMPEQHVDCRQNCTFLNFIVWWIFGKLFAEMYTRPSPQNEMRIWRCLGSV